MRSRVGLLLAEGTSDAPLAGLVEQLMRPHGVQLRLIAPDFAAFNTEVGSTLRERLRVALKYLAGPPHCLVLHRDADKEEPIGRVAEMREAIAMCQVDAPLVPVVPVRMTEAWLLLDEVNIRRASGNPRGSAALHLPQVNDVERLVDPKAVLRDALIIASELRGRRRAGVARRFTAHRRQLLQTLDIQGHQATLPSWQRLLGAVQEAAVHMR